MPARILLTGAADPRGSEEYNLALGERRARSVERFLVTMGVAHERISLHSVGEENATGTDEGSWSLDRHVVATLD
jgi:peptidoglycan-associated lipoprotein